MKVVFGVRNKVNENCAPISISIKNKDLLTISEAYLKAVNKADNLDYDIINYYALDFDIVE